MKNVLNNLVIFLLIFSVRAGEVEFRPKKIFDPSISKDLKILAPLKGKAFCAALTEKIRKSMIIWEAYQKPRCSEINRIEKWNKSTMDAKLKGEDPFYRPDKKDDIKFQIKCINKYPGFYRNLSSLKGLCGVYSPFDRAIMKKTISSFIENNAERERFVANIKEDLKIGKDNWKYYLHKEDPRRLPK